jgi:hypothetical protein
MVWVSITARREASWERDVSMARVSAVVRPGQKLRRTEMLLELMTLCLLSNSRDRVSVRKKLSLECDDRTGRDEAEEGGSSHFLET